MGVGFWADFLHHTIVQISHFMVAILSDIKEVEDTRADAVAIGKTASPEDQPMTVTGGSSDAPSKTSKF